MCDIKYSFSVLAVAAIAGASFVMRTADAAPATANAAADAAVAVSTVKVEGYQFSGNSAFTSDVLQGLIADDVGKQLSLNDIRRSANKIAIYYHEHGYTLASVIVPKQVFSADRPIKLVVLEGRLGAVTVKGNKRFSAGRVRHTLEAAGLVEGQTIDMDHANVGMTRLNRNSGVNATATLGPGVTQGSTDLKVDVTEKPRVTGSLELDNYGSEQTGRIRLMPRVKFNDLTGRGDELNVVGLKSFGSGDSYYGYLNYKLPIGVRGRSVEFYGSNGNINVGQQFSVLNLKGKNTGFGIGFHQDKILSPQSILTYSAWFEANNFQEDVLGTSLVRDNIRKLRLGVDYDHSDAHGRTLLSGYLHRGLGAALGGMPNDSVESSRPQADADNNFTKITFDVARIQRFTPRFTGIGRVYGQYAFDSVVSGEEFGIGGFNSVIGYPSGVYAGDSGFVVSAEGRYNILPKSNAYQLIGQINYGQISVKTPFIGQESSERVSGLGIGLLAMPVKQFTFRVDVGVPLEHRTQYRNQFYAMASYNF